MLFLCWCCPVSNWTFRAWIFLFLWKCNGNGMLKPKFTLLNFLSLVGQLMAESTLPSSLELPPPLCCRPAFSCSVIFVWLNRGKNGLIKIFKEMLLGRGLFDHCMVSGRTAYATWCSCEMLLEPLHPASSPGDAQGQAVTRGEQQQVPADTGPPRYLCWPSHIAVYSALLIWWGFPVRQK